MSLIKMLLKAGYSEKDIFHHESDLYIYDTPETRKVLKKYCIANGWNNLVKYLEQRFVDCFVIKSFQDNITNRMMFDCAFQYYKFN